jgi:hypothetical protein
MRKLTLPIICLTLFVALAFGYSGHGYTQGKRTIVAKPRPRPSPTPIPTDDDDFFADIPDAKPTATPLPEWKYIGFASREVMIYYNTQRVSHPTPNILRVWIKMRPLGKARDKWIGKLDDDSHDYTDYAYTVSQEEYDCAGVRARLLQATDYTRGAEVILSSETPGNWHELVPGSIGEGVLKAVCSYKE